MLQAGDAHVAPRAYRFGFFAVVAFVRIKHCRLKAPACTELTPHDFFGRHDCLSRDSLCDLTPCQFTRAQSRFTQRGLARGNLEIFLG